MYEAGNNKEQSVNHYRQAANLFTTDNKKTSASPCLLKIASIQSLNDQFTEAAGIFEAVGKECTESRLGAFSAKGHFTNALLCHLAAGDLVAARQKLDEFKDTDHTFPTSRECGFIEKLIAAVESNNSEDFATACAEYDNITPMDKWKVSICLKAKRHIMAGGDDDEEGIC
jgi:alpha-soluble NSF attachment protein